MKSVTKGGLLLAWLSALMGTAAFGTVTAKPTIHIVAIPGEPLPDIVATRQGLFDRQGIQVEISVVPNSNELRSALATGQADVAHAAVDNAVALADSGKDVIIVMGGELSLNDLFAQPTIHSIPELRGRTLIVDAPNTAFALQMIDILRKHGLTAGDYHLVSAGTTPKRFAEMHKHPEDAASMIGPPWSILARHDGFVNLGSAAKLIGPYQSIGGLTTRSWARQHPELLERYLAAYIEGQRWLMAPANKTAVISLFEEHWHLPAWAAGETYALLMAEGNPWYERDASFSIQGFQNVLKLRAEIEGDWGGHAPPAQKYYELSYYEAALTRLKPR